MILYLGVSQKTQSTLHLIFPNIHTGRAFQRQ